MGLLRRLWTDLPPDPRSAASIWGWWERQRITFNLIVLPAGFVSFILLITITANAISLPVGEDMAEPFSVLAAPILLNVLYTGGALFESFVWSLNRGRTAKTGPVLFVLGTGAILLMMAFVVFWPFLFPGRIPPPAPPRGVLL